jgi:hypothetical protein
MPKSRPIITLALGLALLGVPASARADGEDPEKLFADASALMEKEKYTEALPKLETAQRLDPGIGTQFNLAVCYEKLGRLGAAWRNYTAVVQLARASGKKAREDAARTKLTELAPRVPKLAIRMQEQDKADAIIRIDGVILGKDDLAAYPVDPGPHRIEATASSKKPWSQTVPTPPDGTTKDIEIPLLESVKGETKVVTVTQETTNGRRTLGFVLGGIGVAGIAAGAVTGILVLNAKSTADERCTPRCVSADGKPDQEGIDAVNRGNTLIPINAIAFGVGVVGLAAGAYFLLTSKKPSTAATTVTPLFGSGSAGLSLSRGF